MSGPENLQAVADGIRETRQPHVDTVRVLLSWFGQQRRGGAVVGTVRAALREAGLRTTPNFETAYIDGSLVFTLAEEAAGRREATVSEEPDATDSGDATDDPVARIRMLPAANRRPVRVSRDSTVAEAVTLMLLNDFSQLPVMQTDRDVKGLVSWRSIGRAKARNARCDVVGECMERVVEISDDMPLLEAIDTVAKQEVALVRASADRRITGIITTSDLGLQFHELAEPFLLLAEIENQIRRLIDGRFTPAELVAAKDPGDGQRGVEGVADLSLGEYVRLLEDPAKWERLQLSLDRRRVVRQLHRVGNIRNDVMHFSPDGTSPEDLKCLRDTVRFMQQIY